MSKKFDFEAALKAVQSGQAITDKDVVLAPLVKQLTEAALEGEFELKRPRDRAGTFEPQLVKRHQRTVSNEIESKILSMFGVGLSYADIASQVEKMYGINVSTATISTITDKLIDEVKAWQFRPLDTLYPFV